VDPQNYVTGYVIRWLTIAVPGLYVGDCVFLPMTRRHRQLQDRWRTLGDTHGPQEDHVLGRNKGRFTLLVASAALLSAPGTACPP
jgi:hypothetical protein